jgi:hypothetical protein
MTSTADIESFDNARVVGVWAVGRLWRDYLNGPLYVPTQGRELLVILEAQGPTRVIGELERLSALGSPWASAALGYVCLMPDTDGKRDANRAAELCKPHADAGDAYALYIFAWAKFLAGDHEVALGAMKKSAMLHFPPATLDLTTFVWKGTTQGDSSPALRLLRYAEMTQHKAALLWRCQFYASGRFGVARRVLGYSLLPIAKLRYWIALLLDPFSSKVFVFRSWEAVPLFRLRQIS